MKIFVLFSGFFFFASVQAQFFNNISEFGRALTNIGLYITEGNNSERFSIKNLSLFPSDKLHKTLKLPTVLFCYGYSDNFPSPAVDLITAAYNLRGGFNVLVIDWSDYADGDYISTLFDVHSIANVFAKKFYGMHANASINLTTWHFIGHSLGAHILVFIARRIQEISKMQVIITRLTGLDVACPGFYQPIIYDLMKPLRKSDGESENICRL